MELIFIVNEAPEGGYTARALNQSIFTEGETFEKLKGNIKDALLAHFGKLPKTIGVLFQYNILQE